MVIILVSLAILGAYSSVNLAPVPNDLFAVSTPIYRIWFYVALMFMTINENLIANVIPVVGLWWESLLNLLVLSALLGLIVYYLPFQVPQGNQWRAGLTASAWWIAACTVVVKNSVENPDSHNRVIDYICLFGIFPLFFVGYYLVNQRYLIFQGILNFILNLILLFSRVNCSCRRN